MGIINIFKKGVRHLKSGVDTWVVKWTARYGEFYGDTTKRYQAFTDKQEALDFADSIRRAHKLIGNTSGTRVTVTKTESGLDDK